MEFFVGLPGPFDGLGQCLVPGPGPEAEERLGGTPCLTGEVRPPLGPVQQVLVREQAYIRRGKGDLQDVILAAVVQDVPGEAAAHSGDASQNVTQIFERGAGFDTVGEFGVGRRGSECSSRLSLPGIRARCPVPVQEADALSQQHHGDE